jgi:hypothetical protein
MKEAQSEENRISVNKQLIEVFTSHNIEIKGEINDWIVFPKYSQIASSGKKYLVRLPKLSGQIVKISHHPTVVSVQLDILVELFDGRILIESCAGIGNNQEKAIANSLQNFYANSLHVMLNAFYGVEDEQVNVETWQITGKDWKAVIGGFVLKTFEKVPLQVPESVFPTFENLIKNQELNNDIHWFRFFYAQQDKQFLDCETLFDNELWQDANKELTELNWELTKGYHSVRNFLILINTSYGKLKNVSEFTDLVIKGVETFRDNSQADEQTLINMLISKGIDNQDALDLVDFIPIAFARAGFEHLSIKFQDYVEKVTRNGTVIERKRLSEIAIYNEAYKFAGENAGLFLDNDEFLAIQVYSAEFKVINDMLNQGSEPANIMLSPITMLANELNTGKSWWQFWK